MMKKMKKMNNNIEYIFINLIFLEKIIIINKKFEFLNKRKNLKKKKEEKRW